MKWIYEGSGLIRDETGGIIAVTATGHYDKGRLIAAAPALLEALEQAAAGLATIANRGEWLFGHELTLHIREFAKENFDKARAAIARAKGESK